MRQNSFTHVRPIVLTEHIRIEYRHFQLPVFIQVLRLRIPRRSALAYSHLRLAIAQKQWSEYLPHPPTPRRPWLPPIRPCGVLLSGWKKKTRLESGWMVLSGELLGYSRILESQYECGELRYILAGLLSKPIPFSFSNQITQAHSQSYCEITGNFDSNTNFSQFNRTDVGAVHIGAFSKILLG
jgi:hypothetical protein